MIRVPPTLPTILGNQTIALIGEAPGEREEACRRPFIGPSGTQLNGWLAAAGIERASCFIDNVLSFLPRCPIEALTVSAKELKLRDTDPTLGRPEYRLPLWPNKYLPPELWPELDRLNTNLLRVKPTVIAAIGRLAVWALLGKQGVEQYCGLTFVGHLGIKVVPVIHPAAVLRAYQRRPLCVRAMKRIAVERASTEPVIVHKPRTVHLLDVVADVEDVVFRMIMAGELVSFDIETHPASGTVRSIAFGNKSRVSYCVVFCSEPWGAGNYWDAHQEHTVVLAIRRLLESPVPKLAQNGAYDVVFLWMALGIRVVNYVEDTRLKHHALSPEEPKDLATLGKKYLPDAGDWKDTYKHVREGKDK